MADDQVSSLRAAALSTLRAKRNKPGVEKAALRPPPPDSLQLDYGLEEEPATLVQIPANRPNTEPVSEDVEIREEGEISEEEEIAPPAPQSPPPNEPKSPVKSSPAPAPSRRRTPEASPVSRRHKPATPSGCRIQLTATQMALLSLDANHVRPGLQMTQQQYGTAKDIILDLLGWGVPPEFLVECGLSREIVFYVFVELNLRLPQNLDTVGLIPYTPESVAAAQKAAASRMEQEPDLVKADNGAAAPATDTFISSNSLHDMEMQRKQELLARKRAVIASRKPKPTLTTTTTTDVDSFLKSITPPSKGVDTPPSSTSLPASDDAMDVDDIPGLGVSYPPTEALRPGIEKSDSVSSVGSSTSAASRRGTKRPVASDFVDLDTHPRMNGSGYSYARRKSSTRTPIDFGSVSNGNRRCVIDLSDSEEETEGMLRPDDVDPTPGSSTTPPGGGIKERSELELEIQRMKELIAMKERERLIKLASRVHGSGESAARTEGDAKAKDEGVWRSVGGRRLTGSGGIYRGRSGDGSRRSRQVVLMLCDTVFGYGHIPYRGNLLYSRGWACAERGKWFFGLEAGFLTPLTPGRRRAGDGTLRRLQGIHGLGARRASAGGRCGDRYARMKYQGAESVATGDAGTCTLVDRAGGERVKAAGDWELFVCKIYKWQGKQRLINLPFSPSQVDSFSGASLPLCMSFRRVSSAAPNPPFPSYPAPNPIHHYQPADTHDPASPASPSMRKRPRTHDIHPATSSSADSHPPQQQPAQPVADDAFINDQDAVDSAAEDDEDEEKPKSDKKAGRRKIKIEFIQDKSRRHITFSKRKAGIMKKAYELSTLTGTQVLLLVVSETGLVYTFTTAKLQPLVTQPEGKNLIQACLNAPHGSVPSSMPIGTPIGRASGPMSMPAPPPGSNNLPGGLSIGNAPSGNSVKEDDDDGDNEDATHGGRATAGGKRRRRASSNAGGAPASAASARGATSPHSPNSTIPPPPLSIPTGTGQAQASPASHQPQQPPPPQISLGSPTSPQQQHQQVSANSPAQYSSGSYAHHASQQHHQQAPQHEAPGMYSSHMISPGGYGYGSGPGSAPTQGGQQLGGLAAAAAQHGHWPQQPPVGQGSHYGRR